MCITELLIGSFLLGNYKQALKTVEDAERHLSTWQKAKPHLNTFMFAE